MHAGNAVVTGAAGILGPAICQTLRSSGWQVFATDRHAVDFDLAADVIGIGKFWNHRFITDISSKSACDTLIQEAETAIGPVHLLVNNAALSYRVNSLADLEEDRALELLRVNLLAPLWLTAAAEESLTSTTGTIINISSAQTQGWLAENHLYVSSKAALEKLTETLASSFGPRGIRCVGIRIGSFPGDHFMRDHLRDLPPEAARSLYREVFPRHLDLSRKALGNECVGTPADLAELIVFLTSEHARMLHGSILNLDGGFTSRPAPWVGISESRKWSDAWAASWKENHPR